MARWTLAPRTMAREKTSAWKMFWGRARASSQLPRRNPSPRMFRRSRPRRIRAGFRHQASGVTGLDFRALAPEGFRPARVVRRGSKFVRAVVGLWSFAVGRDIRCQWRTTNDQGRFIYYEHIYDEYFRNASERAPGENRGAD